MLEVVREFVAGRLDETGAASEARDRHAEHLAGLAAEAAPRLRTGGAARRRPHPRRGGPVDRPRTGEEANLRAALAHCRDAGRTAVGLRIAVALAWWWYLAAAGPRYAAGSTPSPGAAAGRADRGGRRAGDSVVGHLSLDTVPGEQAWRRITGRTDVVVAGGRPEEAVLALEVQCLNSLMVLAETAGEYERVDELGRRALRLAEELGLPEMHGVLRIRIAWGALSRGDLQRAGAELAAVRESVRAPAPPSWPPWPTPSRRSSSGNWGTSTAPGHACSGRWRSTSGSATRRARRRR